MQIITGSVKTKNLNFQTCSKSLCLGVSKATKWLAAQSTWVTEKAYRHLSKKMKKMKKRKKKTKKKRKLTL